MRPATRPRPPLGGGQNPYAKTMTGVEGGRLPISSYAIRQARTISPKKPKRSPPESKMTIPEVNLRIVPKVIKLKPSAKIKNKFIVGEKITIP